MVINKGSSIKKKIAKKTLGNPFFLGGVAFFLAMTIFILSILNVVTAIAGEEDAANSGSSVLVSKYSIEAVYETFYMTVLSECDNSTPPQQTSVPLWGGLEGKRIEGDYAVTTDVGNDAIILENYSRVGPGMGTVGFTYGTLDSVVDYFASLYEENEDAYALYEPFVAYNNNHDKINSKHPTRDFIETWRNVFNTNGPQFTYDQLVYAYDAFYVPAKTIYENKTGINIDTFKAGTRMALTSISIRWGSDIIRVIADAVASEPDNEERIINVVGNMFSAKARGDSGRAQKTKDICLGINKGDYDIYEDEDWCLAFYKNMLDGGIITSAPMGDPEKVKQIMQGNAEYQNFAWCNSKGITSGDIGPRGCSVCSFAMIASYITGKNITPQMVGAASVKYHYNMQSFHNDGLKDMAHEFSFEYMGGASYPGVSYLAEKLKQGYVCGISVSSAGGCYWTGEAHHMGVLAIRENAGEIEVYVVTSSNSPKDYTNSQGGHNGWYNINKLSPCLQDVRLFMPKNTTGSNISTHI